MRLWHIIPISIIFFVTACATPGANGSAYLQCVPYARNLSGIQIYGDAYTWWDKAQKTNYLRGKTPKLGSVLVLSKTNRLKYGHIAVVKNIVSKRKIEVAHANWGNDFLGRGNIFKSMAVEDVSPNNDWSQVKFWSPASQSYGYTYSVSGFVYNKRQT